MTTDAIFPTPGGPLTIFVASDNVKASTDQAKDAVMTVNVAAAKPGKDPRATIVVETKPGWVRVVEDKQGNYTVEPCEEPEAEVREMPEASDG